MHLHRVRKKTNLPVPPPLPHSKRINQKFVISKGFNCLPFSPLVGIQKHTPCASRLESFFFFMVLFRKYPKLCDYLACHASSSTFLIFFCCSSISCVRFGPDHFPSLLSNLSLVRLLAIAEPSHFCCVR
ncbi:unnamed protein product [Ixodes persulcatus]